MRKIEFNKKEEKDVVNRYVNQHQTIAEISEYYNTFHQPIDKIFKKYGVKVRNNIRNFINEDYFESIDSEYKSYFLGFLLADGCIADKFNTKPGAKWQKQLHLIIQERDRHILEKLKEELNSTNKINFHKGRNTVATHFSSNRLCDSLIRLGITPRKSLTANLDIDKIPTHLWHHFIRGLFDGDGCITYYYSKSHYIKNDGGRSITFCNKFDICGSLKVCQMVKNILAPVVSETDKNKQPISQGNIYRMFFNTQESIGNIYSYLYKDATLFLKRKKEKFEFIIKHILESKNKRILNKSSQYIGIQKIRHKTKKGYTYSWLSSKFGNKQTIRIGQFKTEKQAYLALCKYEDLNKLPFSNNPKEYLKIKQETL